VYRRLLRESPAYLRNHEEVTKALEEGIYYAEGLSPKTVRLDQHGHVSALVSEERFYNEEGQWGSHDEEHILPARAILVATGASPNVAYEFENPNTFKKKSGVYETYDLSGKHIPITQQPHVKTSVAAFTSYDKEERRVTFVGDTHPVFHGSVVKAIASGLRTYPQILDLLADKQFAGNEEEYQQFSQSMADQFSAQITAIKRHTPSVIELEVRAPLAIVNYQPGHFYRLQNFETSAPQIAGTLLQTEATALLACDIDKDKKTLRMMVLEQGVSSRLLATLKVGDDVALMGPSGVRTRIADQPEDVLVIGGRLSAAHLLSIGKKMRAKGSRILYMAGLKSADEVFCQNEIEQAADKIIWVTQHGAPVTTHRPQDLSISGNLTDALLQYAQGTLNTDHTQISLQKIDRVLLIGKFGFLRAMRKMMHSTLKPYLTKNPPTTASVYGPMQCMLKGVCAQCLVWQIDPNTGQRTKAVFACSWHDQPFDMVDIDNLAERLAQNRMQETLSNLWLDHLFTQHNVARV
jgi:NAD(P)H-flavin reductase